MTRDEALKKIKKCLALGRSAETHEAGAAMRQAQKLMELFSLREQDISMADVAEVKIKAVSTAANAWEVRLKHMVAEAFGCDSFAQLTGRYNDTGNLVRERHYVFVGINAAPTVAGYAYEVLSRQCAKARLEHIRKQPKNCKPITKTARGDAFAMGWARAVQSLVDRFAQPAADKALLALYIEDKHPDMQEGKTRDTTKERKTDFGHVIAGHKAGQQAQLHPGVSGMAQQGLLT
ncbi:MAG: DUF2786 domain-containing protein [Simplicispira sp.]|nr:DUF2786 domain-containing protein [Simplicispira sp.]